MTSMTLRGAMYTSGGQIHKEPDVGEALGCGGLRGGRGPGSPPRHGAPSKPSYSAGLWAAIQRRNHWELAARGSRLVRPLLAAGAVRVCARLWLGQCPRLGSCWVAVLPHFKSPGRALYKLQRVCGRGDSRRTGLSLRRDPLAAPHARAGVAAASVRDDARGRKTRGNEAGRGLDRVPERRAVRDPHAGARHCARGIRAGDVCV
jgi:hypothetical protein